MHAHLDFDDPAGQRMHIDLAGKGEPRLVGAGIALGPDQLQPPDHVIGHLGPARDRQIHVDRLLGAAQQGGEALELAAERVHHRSEPDAVAVLRDHLRPGDVGRGKTQSAASSSASMA